MTTPTIITYSENEIATAKADKAQLNAFCKSLNDERIRIGKVYSSPYKCVILVNENSIKDGDIEILIKELPKFNRVN